MQSFPKQKKKKRAKKKEPERPSIMHSRESGTCYLCMMLHNDYRRHPALQEDCETESICQGPRGRKQTDAHDTGKAGIDNKRNDQGG